MNNVNVYCVFIVCCTGQLTEHNELISIGNAIAIFCPFVCVSICVCSCVMKSARRAVAKSLVAELLFLDRLNGHFLNFKYV